VSAVDRLRTSLADDPEKWSEPLRLIAGAVLELAVKSPPRKCTIRDGIYSEGPPPQVIHPR
jgi:hypothetical protein